MYSEEEKLRIEAQTEAEQRAEQSPYGKAHLKIKSTKGRFASNRQPPKKKHKK